MKISHFVMLLSALYGHCALALVDKAEPTTGFNVIGYIQDFSVDDLNDPLSSAKMTINGMTVIIPKNLKIVMPGTYLTANDIFRGSHGRTKAQGNNPVTPALKRSCIALKDKNDPDGICKNQPEFPYTAEIVGNIATDPVDNQEKHIAGLVNIGQIPLQISGGFIRTICYTGTEPNCTQKGELLIGSKKPDTNQPDNTIPARLRLNDPKGRFGLADSPDERFTADLDNPTVHAATGYPVCIPRADNDGDPRCPMKNRPKRNGKFLNKFTIGGITARNFRGIQVPGAFICEDSGNDTPVKPCDSHEMVPLVVGDYIVYSGILQKNANGNIHISAYSLEADLGVYTSPGVDPAYVFIEEAILGAGGTAFPGIDQETGPGKVIPGQTLVTRFRIVGFTTDPSRTVDVFAMDVKDANSIEQKPRLIQSISTEPVAPIGRFETTIDQRVFMPPPREIRAQIHSIWDTNNPEKRLSQEPEQSANGLTFGRYDAPVAEYIFPEGRVFGGKVPQPGLIPANFEDLCFLSVGSGLLDTLDRCAEKSNDCPQVDANLPTVRQLSPWPASELEPKQTTNLPKGTNRTISSHQPPGIFCPQPPNP